MASSHPTTSSHENKKSRKRARNQQQQQQKLQHQPWVPDFPYNADYNDHFETPLRAYEDISPLLDWLVDDIGNKKKTVKSRKDHVIYDPYYCNGQTTTLFRSLGFDGIINRKRDFYEDIAQNNLPKNFQTLVTNPPYSDQHKEKCLDFAFAQLREHKKPFFLLMPNYVASREYYRTREQGDVVYLLPSEPYEYNHPEGTGKEIPPFTSLWFCGIGKERVQTVKGYWESIQWKEGQPKPTLAVSLESLRMSGTIPTQKRPNPRQRKKQRQHAQRSSNPPPTIQEQPILLDSLLVPSHKHNNDTSTHNLNKKKQRSNPNSSPISAQRPNEKGPKASNKKSKHRDSHGQRQKKRF